MGNFFTPMRMWAITFALLAFDVILVYLFINQPTVLSVQSQWDIRHQDLRQLEQQQQQQVRQIMITPTPLSVEDFVNHPQATSPAQILRLQTPADSQGKVL